jgi:hypothetical protein
MAWLWTAALAVLLAASIVGGPQDQRPREQTIADCLEGVRTTRAKELRAVGQGPERTRLNEEATQQARACADRFTLHRLPASELETLLAASGLEEAPGGGHDDSTVLELRRG